VYYDNPRVVTILPAKPVKNWFTSIASMAFYVGVLSGIGYLLQITLF
jgi:hypothetical protein